MADDYSVEVCNTLEQKFLDNRLHRPMRIERYDKGKELFYDVQGFSKDQQARVHLVIEKFVGGGFAGQVYRVRILAIDTELKHVDGLEVGGVYAIKIMVPPSRFSQLFRNSLYWIGFQSPFQLQVNPHAARAGALWQKLIRRGAKVRFGSEACVVNIFATFVDDRLGSCGEISEWVDGRSWRLEVDDHMDALALWNKGRKVDVENLGSAEYRTKKVFMEGFVKLLHEMGGFEFARQYEWSTCKSQPNCLKRSETEMDPYSGLVAVDFRAGLVLLPFLPMSPGDFKLIYKGIARGSVVQFDRGSIDKLEVFTGDNFDKFADMTDMIEELKAEEKIYRDSVIDITHNHVRLISDGNLWKTIADSMVTGWQVKGLISAECERKFRKNYLRILLFLLMGIIPFFGRILRRVSCQENWRQHYKQMFTNLDYFERAISGKMAEKLICWHRKGRVSAKKAKFLASRPLRFICHLPLSIAPVFLHRIFTDRDYALGVLYYVCVRPVKLYFNAEMREQWLREMVAAGRQNHMLSDDDAETILCRINEPFIQKYLKSLAVHVCTLPVTQVVSVTVAVIYLLMHPELSWQQGAARAGAILVAFQVVPISPGSLARGLYVLYLVLKEKNFKDYNIAVFLGFFKYVGYLAFPIQMAYHYPVLARFMAAHWATGAVHIIPVFGENGALLEHWVFRAFYNWPLTIRRRMRKRAEARKSMASRYWHVPLTAAAAAVLLGVAALIIRGKQENLPDLYSLKWAILLIALASGAFVTLYAGGAVLWKRIVSGVCCGALIGAFYTFISSMIAYESSKFEIAGAFKQLAWGIFAFVLLVSIGVIITEMKIRDPDIG